jgi:opacity protein-like surface antigen
MKKLLFLAVISALLMPGVVLADFNRDRDEGRTTPFLVGEWYLNDTFTTNNNDPNLNNPGNPSGTVDTQFTFINPTAQVENFAYAFYDADGGFCGCDTDTNKAANSRTRYNMSGEATGPFTCTGAALKTEGTLKVVGYLTNADGSFRNFEDATIAGHQVHFGVSYNGGSLNNTESSLTALPLNDDTERDIIKVLTACKVIGDPPKHHNR